MSKKEDRSTGLCAWSPHHNQHYLLCPYVQLKQTPCECDKEFYCTNRSIGGREVKGALVCKDCYSNHFNHPDLEDRQLNPKEGEYVVSKGPNHIDPELLAHHHPKKPSSMKSSIGGTVQIRSQKQVVASFNEYYEGGVDMYPGKKKKQQEKEEKIISKLFPKGNKGEGNPALEDAIEKGGIIKDAIESNKSFGTICVGSYRKAYDALVLLNTSRRDSIPMYRGECLEANEAFQSLYGKKRNPYVLVNLGGGEGRTVTQDEICEWERRDFYTSKEKKELLVMAKVHVIFRGQEDKCKAIENVLTNQIFKEDHPRTLHESSHKGGISGKKENYAVVITEWMGMEEMINKGVLAFNKHQTPKYRSKVVNGFSWLNKDDKNWVTESKKTYKTTSSVSDLTNEELKAKRIKLEEELTFVKLEEESRGWK